MSLEKLGMMTSSRKFAQEHSRWCSLLLIELLIENKKWQKVLMSDVYTTHLKAFVVDEAHTVSKWYVSSHIHTV